ncbi:MAG: hypothetical protein IKW10_05850 [Oscillospiraceae bacterium]|nr:hypothetical protein [Oscillospiraceae bacterium]
MDRILYIICLLLLLLLGQGKAEESDTQIESSTEWSQYSPTEPATGWPQCEAIPSTQEQTEYGVPSFCLSDYHAHTDFYIENKIKINVGTVENPEQAEDKAKAVWKEHMEYDSYEYKKLLVFYDPENDAWLAILDINYDALYASDDWAVLDCIPCVIINRNGDVLALWAE